MSGFFEGNLHIVTQVIAALRPTRILLAAAEKVLENAAAAKDFAENLERIVEPSGAPKATRAPIKRSVAILIISRTLLGIIEHLVGFAQFFKLFLRGFIARVFVRMILYGKFPVSLFDLLIPSALL